MKLLWKYISQHVLEDFNVREYAMVLAFLAISVYVNYRYEFVDNYIQPLTGFTRTFTYFTFYAIAYYSGALILAWAKPQLALLRNSGFWQKSLFALALLSLDSSMPYLRESINALLNLDLHYWVLKVCVNLFSIFTVMLPIMIFAKYDHTANNEMYGLSRWSFDKRPYIIMLLIMLPILIAASFHPSFMKQYPMYKATFAHEYLGVPEWLTVSIYEFAYGLDFVTVELLFRGFLVIGMISVLGRNAVMPMAMVYCFLHFGKPAGEAISSVAGGYILGAIAYSTRSIWGGVMVHLGIAWMMELIAFIQKL